MHQVGMQNFEERPNQVPWPPLIYVAAAAAAVVLHFIVPLPWPSGPWRLVLSLAGLVLVAIAVVIDIAAVRAFRRHQTTIFPNRGATKLITSGPFRHSRNPIYLGNTLAVSGAGLLFGVAWLIPAAFIAAGLVQKLAIEREEKHLSARFGSDWKAYAAQTPRWIGPL
jgi:protein-S-isoprenylcysteine O-methyltransferase Ste14